jgi:hypothetical protein
MPRISLRQNLSIGTESVQSDRIRSIEILHFEQFHATDFHVLNVTDSNGLNPNR